LSAFALFYFIARLRPNPFAIIATAFALPSLGQTAIRKAEQGFQNQGNLNKAIPGAIVMSMRREFESILAGDLDLTFEKARPEGK
jgi:hypothetical protein